MCNNRDNADLFRSGAGVDMALLCGGHASGVYPFSLAESAKYAKNFPAVDFVGRYIFYLDVAAVCAAAC